MGIEYASEKMWAALGTLATSTEPLQERLMHAHLTFAPIRPDEDLPSDELKIAYKEIMDRLTADKSDREKGYVPTTTERMTDEEAYQVVDLLVSFAHLVEMHRRND